MWTVKPFIRKCVVSKTLCSWQLPVKKYVPYISQNTLFINGLGIYDLLTSLVTSLLPIYFGRLVMKLIMINILAKLWA